MASRVAAVDRVSDARLHLADFWVLNQLPDILAAEHPPNLIPLMKAVPSTRISKNFHSGIMKEACNQGESYE